MTAHTTTYLALLTAISGVAVIAGCNSFQTSTDASLASDTRESKTFVGTTQPVRDYDVSVAHYQSGDVRTGSTGVRWVNGVGPTAGQEGAQTGPAGGYGYVGANNAAGGAGGASGATGTAVAGSSDTSFTGGVASNTGTGLSGTSVAAGTNTGAGTGGNTGIVVTSDGSGATVGSAGSSANQTAAANAAAANADVGAGANTNATGGINDGGIVTSNDTVNSGTSAAAISGRNVTSGAGAAAGSATGTGTIGGTDVTGRTGVDATGVVTSNANVNTNANGGVAVAGGTQSGTATDGTNTAGGQSFGQQAATAGRVAATPFVGAGTFIGNVVTSPYTLIEQRDGITSAGVQFPRTHTAMPALPPDPANSPVNPQDVPQAIVPLPGQPETAPLSADLSGGNSTTQPYRPAILIPATNPASETAFTIAGDVQFPGRYETGTNITIIQAMRAAGVNSAADPNKVSFRLARKGEDPAEATLAQVRDRQVDDVLLMPGDLLTVLVPIEAVIPDTKTTAPRDR